LRRDWDTSWGAADIVRRCALFTTWHPLLLGCEPFQSCITGGRAEHQSRQSLQAASGVAADLALMRRMDELHLEFMSLLKFPQRLEILAGSPYRHLCMPKTSSV
jgi:hypothetical protein